MNKVNYPKNTQGRDFVCGDLHGAYVRLQDALEFIKFDKNVDRMFSVGDLVDRGPQNEECLRLLNEPWFHAVRGNHEQLMDHFYTDGPYGSYWARNGGDWGRIYGGIETNEIQQLSAKAAELPLMITVERQDNKFFHVIHAELGSAGPITDAELENPDLFGEVAFQQSQDGDFILWGRWLFGSLYAKELTPEFVAKFNESVNLQKADSMFNSRLSHIYSGHTIMRQPTRFRGQTNLDTKAFGSYISNNPYGIATPSDWMGLTVTEPLTDRFWLANYYEVKETEVFVL